jgi:hypothetical protein
MRATALCSSSIALALALGSAACGGGDGAPAPSASVAEKKPLVKPKRVESTPLPAQPQAAPPAVAPAPTPPPAPAPEAAQTPSIQPDAPLPDGEQRISDLPGDVPVPSGAQAVSPLLMSSEGIAHGTYEMKGSASSAATSYTAGLLQKGWSVEPARNAGSQALITATKGDRQLSIAIDGSTGDRAQIVIFEMQRPPG